MLDLKELLWDGLSFSGDVLCKTATIVPRKSKSEMDKKTLHYLFYLASHKNIRNEMVFSVTEKDMNDFGITPNEVINCLCDLSYCTGVLIGCMIPVVYELTIIPDIIWGNSPYLYTPPQLPALHGQIAHPRRPLPTTDTRKVKDMIYLK